MPCKWLKICPLRRLEKQGKITDKWKKEYCSTEKNWMNCKRYKYEEEGKYHPDNMMPDGSINKNIK
ncbi:MAG: uracil-DNA glycosylase [Candidatus Nanoarchaeia archaeon]|nr:uracil-DNA glycosylase [Candidatus Nanoarchaeia archaeon]